MAGPFSHDDPLPAGDMVVEGDALDGLDRMFGLRDDRRRRP